jgi:hypothetical protein
VLTQVVHIITTLLFKGLKHVALILIFLLLSCKEEKDHFGFYGSMFMSCCKRSQLYVMRQRIREIPVHVRQLSREKGQRPQEDRSELGPRLVYVM